jgi:predicted RNA-binding Zn-ribbon protein involved in translation (DUF1610 family)
MAERVEHCISCGVRLEGAGVVRFKCPSCGAEMGRCSKCRKQSNAYICQACGFKGP